MSIFTVIIAIIGIVIALGWLPLLIAGIIRLFKKHTTSGIIMTVLGGIWGVLSIIFLVIGLMFFMIYQETSSRSKTENFNPETYQGETGEIKLDGWKNKAKLILKDKSRKRIMLNSSDGSCKAPVGVYSLYSIQLEPEYENQKFSSANIYPGTWQKPYKINIQKNSQLNLNFGEPFNARIHASKRSGNRISFSMKVTDRSGSKSNIYVSGNKKPEVQLLDASGKVIWHKALEYG